MLYYEKDSDSLTDLRYLKCMKITPSSRTIKPQNLLPIEQAIMLHVYWVHFQLWKWNSLMKSTSNYKDWEWRLADASLVPVMTDEEPALDELLKIIWCNYWGMTKIYAVKTVAMPLQWSSGVADCRSYHETECQNGVASELLVDRKNDIEDRFSKHFW